MTRPTLLLLAAVALPVRADDPPVVLVAPPKYKKYEDHLPNHLEAFRADDSGKKVSMKVMYGTSGDAFRLKTTRVVVVIGEVKFKPSPRKSEFSGFGGAQRGTTEYSVHFRPTDKAKPQQLLSGSVWSDHFSPSPFADGYAAHLKVLPDALNDEIGRALFAKVAAAKPKTVRDPDRAGGFDSHGGPTSATAYPMERIKEGKGEMVKVEMDNKLPVTIGIEQMELINAVTGKREAVLSPLKKDAITVDAGKIHALAYGLPRRFPKEDMLMRPQKFFIVVPE